MKFVFNPFTGNFDYTLDASDIGALGFVPYIGSNNNVDLSAGYSLDVNGVVRFKSNPGTPMIVGNYFYFNEDVNSNRFIEANYANPLAVTNLNMRFWDIAQANTGGNTQPTSINDEVIYANLVVSGNVREATTGATENVYGANFNITSTHGIGNSSSTTGRENIYGVSNTLTFSGVIGGVDSTGFLNMYGIKNIVVSNASSSGGESLYGSYNSVEGAGAASGANSILYGSYIISANNLGTTGTTAKYGEYISIAGTADTNYGLYIETSGATTNWGIYQSSNINNAINGLLRVGGVTAPTAPLDVTGNTLITLSAAHVTGLYINGGTDYTGATTTWYGINNRRDSTSPGGNTAYTGYTIYNNGFFNNSLTTAVTFAFPVFAGVYSDVSNTSAHFCAINSPGWIAETNYGGSFKITRSGYHMTTDSYGGGYVYCNNYGVQGFVVDSTSTLGDTTVLVNSNYGGYFQITETATIVGAGSITKNNYGLYVTISATTTGVTKSYGLYINAVSGADTNWGIFQNANVNNVINGNLRVGGITVPTVALDVTGSGAISGDLSFTIGKIYLGAPVATNLSSIYYDGNLVLNPKEQGSGQVSILGDMKINQYALYINGTAGSIVADIRFQSGASDRWYLRNDGTAESGSDVGSDFRIRSRHDAGTSLSDVVYIQRSTGNIKIGTVGTAPTAATAKLHIAAGIGGAITGSAPLKFTTGTLLTTPEAGAIEYLSGVFYIRGTDRLTVTGGILIDSDTSKLTMGAGSDMSFYYDGTYGQLNTSLIAASDLRVTCGANKTVELQNVVYDDIRINIGNISRPGGSDPAWVSYNVNGGGVSTYLLEFAKNNYGTFTVQLPHAYKTGQDIKVHVHWTPGPRGNEENGATVGWKVLYSWANIDGTFPTMATADCSDACDGTDHKHQMSPEVTIDGHTVAKGISSMLICNIIRTDTGADDTWAGTASGELPMLLEVDFHFPIDTIGSRDWGTK